MNVFSAFIFVSLLLVIPVHAQLPTCNCQQEFTGDRLDLVKAPGNQSHPIGDADPVTGNYFLLWQSQEPPTATQPQHTIRTVGRIFNRRGSPISSEFEFESTQGVGGTNYSLPVAVVYNSRAAGFLVAWKVSIFNNATQQYDHAELKGALISANGEVLMQSKKLMQLPVTFLVHQILYNRFINQYVVLHSKNEFNKAPILFLQRLSASGNLIANRVLVSSAQGQIDNPEVRLDPNSKRYAVAWSSSRSVTSSLVRIQVFSQTLQKIGPLNLLANANGYTTQHLVYSGKNRAFVVFWNDRNPPYSFVRTINSVGKLLSAPMPLYISPYLAAVRTNPVNDGFIILRGRTPKITRLDEDFNVIEQVLYPSCQGGDRNHPDLLIYNPATSEFLVLWVYSYWARDGGMEIHGRRLKAIPTGSCN